MASFIPGVITNIGRERLAKGFGNSGGFPFCSAVYFKIGEGGFIPTANGNVPKAPNPALTDLESTGSATLFEFQKTLVATDVTFFPPSTIQFRCRLNPTESNDNGFGESPKFFEIGIFDSTNTMIGYATFDEQTKNASKTLTEFIQFYF